MRRRSSGQPYSDQRLLSNDKPEGGKILERVGFRTTDESGGTEYLCSHSPTQSQ
jgi:hypothetical protein